MTQPPTGDFEVGQIWAYQTRPGEERSVFQVFAITKIPYGRAINIFVSNVRIKSPVGSIITTVTHLPYHEDYLLASDAKLLSSHNPPPSDQEGYKEWLLEGGGKPGGVFTIPLAQCIAYLELTLNHGK